MCKQCRSYFIFFHFINETKYFVNSDSLKINWYLNRLLHQKMSGSYQKGLFKAISYDNQLRSAVGSWELQNMEVVLFQKGIANIQPISERIVTAERHRLEIIAQRIDAVDPERLLKRGYSITLHEGKSVHDPSVLKPGDEIVTKLEKGIITSIIK